AAISNAGGLGVLGAAGFPPDQLAERISQIQDLTDKPFGIDILVPSNTAPRPAADSMPKDMRELLPQEQVGALNSIRENLDLPDEKAERPNLRVPDFTPQDQVDTIMEMGVPVLATGLGNPAPYSDQVHAAGGIVMSLVGNVKNAKRVRDGGADIVVAQGHDAGGHTGRIGSMALLPQVLDAVSPTPVVAAGGIGDGRGLSAVLAMGCVGAWCGTVFIPTKEANLDDFRKQRILDAGEEDTRVSRLYSGKTMRNITNELIEAWDDSGTRALPMGLQGILVADIVHSAKEAGREDLLMNAAGQISGLLNEIRPAGDVLEGMVAEAVEILDRRLPAAVTATPAS
ncbi:MAG TPA: nitronate monooxygenase, partial [Dehalococcoidia bacterium]|nr:nitronate monooxygenase [Dehalococcoidia bacterium]